MQKSFFTLLVFILVTTNNIKSYALSSTKKFDTTNQTIRSTKTNFSILIPDSWIKLISVESENVKDSNTYIEKYNFYYEPRNSFNKPLWLMSIYVFNITDWNNLNPSSYKKIASDSNNVYVMTHATVNPYTSRGHDQTYFKRLLIEASTIEFVKENIIVLDEAKKPTKSKTITINNKMLNSKVLYISDNVAYLPIREACEALLYNVSWNNYDRAITIAKNFQTISFYPDSPSRNSGYSIKIVNNIAYINYSFFIWTIKANVEVDENSNIYITKD